MAKVEIHHDFRQAFESIAEQFPEFENRLIADFTRFVDSDRMEYPDYFGRDSIYNWPHEAQREALSHIHIALPPRAFQAGSALQYRTNPRNPEQDACLVYCEHAVIKGRFLLLDFFYPGAHKKAQEERRMRYLAKQAAKFHDDW
ncbi:MAG TPA: type II toxin-antitoxin system YafO family toxin [Candidatus Halomonas stercoripullorum]|uniref:Type II toxin-antitoxin system YafO family toxin n=1 Tax=Candidatus Halomonas stercoripullorum TaxID=2838617 RepID=A0A9D1WMR2_9GAMM|nr:type II toxin-antitoxin system YafO family toxin [Candidatus Halomonas stercoripullorum]